MNATKSEEIKDHICSRIMGLINAQIDIQLLLDEVVSLLKEYLDCSAVGVRLLDGQGNIPYKAYHGFPETFLAKESPLCITHDRCACIEITKGEYDTSSPLYTSAGSFFTDNLQSVNIIRDGMITGRFRGECIKRGYETLALIPVRFAHRYFGLIHLLDEKQGGIAKSDLRFVEYIAGMLGLYFQGMHLSLEKEREFASLVDKIVHDMRSPLTSTILNAELIAMKHEDAVDLEIPELLKSLSRNAEYMSNLIGGLSEFAGGCFTKKSRLDELDLNVFVQELITDMPELRKSGLNITVQPGLPVVKYPSACMRRIFSNLLSNAAIHSSNGAPAALEISCHEKDMFYELSVSDNGKGIEGSELEDIFRPFYRAKGSEEIPGSGLGLSICKKIVEKNGGRIWVYSTPGKGSTFYFTIPK